MIVKLPRRKFLHLAAGAAALPAASRIAWAQTYPSRPVRLVVGFPAGGVADLFGRLIGQSLSAHLGQPVIIENRVGAGSNLATESVVRAMPDGYTLLYATSSNSYNTVLYDKLNFDFIRDIVPVASVLRGIGVLVVHPSFPANTVSEFIAYTKANPGRVNMASGGNGSSQHIYGELFKTLARVDMVHVPYRGRVLEIEWRRGRLSLGPANVANAVPRSMTATAAASAIFVNNVGSPCCVVTHRLSVRCRHRASVQNRV